MVFVWFDKETLDLGPFAFFGESLGKPLPDITGTKAGCHTKGNAQGVKAKRPMIRTIPLSRFEKIADIDPLVVRLFGKSA
ncbi:MAG TPA: hypothetical protein VGF24_27140 [Vicinamibacterales bacterium]